MHKSPSRLICRPSVPVNGRNGGTHLVTPMLLHAGQYTGDPSKQMNRGGEPIVIVMGGTRTSP